MEKTYVKVPFELERARLINEGLRDGWLETRLGFKVRIVCWDVRKEGFPVLGLVSTPLEERVVSYTARGFVHADGSIDSDDIIIMVSHWK